MPVKKNKKINEITREIKAPAFIEYTMKSRKDSATYNLVCLKDKKTRRNKPGPKRQKKNKTLLEDNGLRLFATNLPPETIKNLDLFEEYRKRWGIETSYRMFNLFRPRTTSVNYVIRLFFFLLSTYLYNLWVLINIKICYFYTIKPEKEKVTAYIFLNLLCEFIVPPTADIFSI